MAEAAQAEYEKIAKSARIEPPPPMDSFQLSPMFQVPLADTDSTRTLILESSLGYPPEKPETGRAIERRHAELRDLLEKILRSKSSSDLDSVQGRLVLREEMAAAVNAALKNDGFVKEVYFSRFEVK
ncbi:MAG: flagellar basal body-associated FliL family protein [bacterium]|nr:flagellar basal body-associated FliL family protein [bacterium]